MTSSIQRRRGRAAYRRAADAALKLPVNSELPAITGTPTEGETLEVSNGAWTNTPDSYAYRWTRSGAFIPGATDDSYELTEDDVGETLTATVTATNEGVSASATSAPTDPVEAADEPEAD